MMRALTGKLMRFAGVGALATLSYAALATGLARIGGMAPPAAAVTAYLACAALSYILHRSLTFRSEREHGAAAPRFAATTALGLAVALSFSVAGEAAGLPAEAAFLATSVAVPLVNFVLLDRLVFPERADRRTLRHEP